MEKNPKVAAEETSLARPQTTDSSNPEGDLSPQAQGRASTSTTRTTQNVIGGLTEDAPTLPKEPEIPSASAVAMPLPTQPVLHAALSSHSGSAEALLSLPPPPAYDVHVRDLSIAVPPFRAYIPTPIPIPIPTAVTNLFKKKSANTEATNEPSDGLIVRDVNGTVRSGEMLAIVGGSGSGKTTVLHAIASRLGDLPIARGGVTMTPSATGVKGGGEGRFKGIKSILGFVRQNDYLLPHLTGELNHKCVHRCANIKLYSPRDPYICGDATFTVFHRQPHPNSHR